MLQTHPPSLGLPQFFWMLNDIDKTRYGCLKYNLSSKSMKSQRNKRITTFSEIIDSIKSFVIQGDKNDTLRGLVCGICWIPEGIAINTHQLRFLICKCKSSINGSLQKMGYTSNLGRTEAALAMANAFPILKDNSAELRKWTVRRIETLISTSLSPLMSTPPEGPTQSDKPSQGCFSISLDGIAKPSRLSSYRNDSCQNTFNSSTDNLEIGGTSLSFSQDILPSYQTKEENIIEGFPDENEPKSWILEQNKDDLSYFFQDELSFTF